MHTAQVLCSGEPTRCEFAQFCCFLAHSPMSPHVCHLRSIKGSHTENTHQSPQWPEMSWSHRVSFLALPIGQTPPQPSPKDRNPPPEDRNPGDGEAYKYAAGVQASIRCATHIRRSNSPRRCEGVPSRSHDSRLHESSHRVLSGVQDATNLAVPEARDRAPAHPF